MLSIASCVGLLTRSPRLHSSVGQARFDSIASRGNIFRALNPDQIQAVKSLTDKSTKSVEGNDPNVTVVLAGAGSGKTRVIVHRIAYLLQDLKVPANAIVATTFTNKAANEIVERVEKLLNDSISLDQSRNSLPQWIGTFHSLCYRMLMLHPAQSRANNATFLDQKMQGTVVKKLMLTKEVNIDTTENKALFDSAVKHINSQKDHGLRARPVDNDSALTEDGIYTEYQRICDESNYMDYNEVLMRTYELLRDHPDVLAHYRRQFRYIHVDEYQDTNTIQYKILRLLVNNSEGAAASAPSRTASASDGGDSVTSVDTVDATGHRLPSLFVVGDDDQAIYGFRGAKPDIMQQVRRDYPHCALIKLTQNYRSTRTILTGANTVIANNHQRLGKDLWTANDNKLDEPIHVHRATTDEGEAKYVAEQILRRTSESPSSTTSQYAAHSPRKFIEKRDFMHKDIVVIVRTHRQAHVLERVLKTYDIPYEIRGGIDYYEREEIQHILAYLSLVTNRHDNLAFERVVNTPARGLGGEVMENIQDYAAQHHVSLWTAAVTIVGREAAEDNIKGSQPKMVKSTKQKKEMAALANFLQLINQLDRSCVQHGITSTVQHAIMQSGLYASYETGAAKQTKASLTYQSKLENLAELAHRVSKRVDPLAQSGGSKWVASYRNMHPDWAGKESVYAPFVAEKDTIPVQLDDLGRTPLQRLLHEIKFDIDSAESATTRDVVQIMTIHGAKGLEFPVVFLCGAEQGILPFALASSNKHSYSYSDSESDDDSMIPLDDEQEEEDRRLFYVAVTRAKKVLYLTHSQSRYGAFLRTRIKRSKFIDEIRPKSLLYNAR